MGRCPGCGEDVYKRQPYEQHIFVVELDGEIPALMDAAAYEAFLAK